MSALFGRVKTWATNEDINAADLNAEFNNILNNLTATLMGAYSDTVGKLQEVYDVGTVGTEVLPTTENEEKLALRSLIKKITGKSQWYETPDINLASIYATSSLNTIKNSVASGKTDANNLPYFLQAPGGASLDLVLDADPTSFNYRINSIDYEISDDKTLTMTAGPSVGNTATYADTVNTGAITKYMGEMGTRIYLAAPGAAYAARVGMLSAFKTVNGGDTEYFVGVYNTDGALYWIEKAFRGFLLDDTGSAIRVELGAAQTITILQLNWIFAKTDLSITFNTSGREPYIQGSQPSTPIVNDLWYDTVNKVWKIYDGAAFTDSNSLFIGISAQSSAACVATRSLDFYADYSPLCDVSLVKTSVSTAAFKNSGGKISVYGDILDLVQSNPSFSMANDLDAGVVEGANTLYYFYITDTMLLKISDVPPHDRISDLKGYYHPWKPWRCIGRVMNDSGSDFQYISSLGSESYLADGSVSSKKLKPYSSVLTEIQSDDNILAAIPLLAWSHIINGSVESSAVALRTSGRPVMIYLGGNGCYLSVFGAAGNAISIERRDNYNDAWSTVAGFVTTNSDAASANNLTPPVFFDFNPPPGICEYRIVLTNNALGPTITINGIMYFLEI